MIAQIQIVSLIVLLAFPSSGLPQESDNMGVRGKGMYGGKSIPVEFKNGQFGIILRDDAEENPPSKEVPMDPNAMIPRPSIGGTEEVSISDSTEMLHIGEWARVKLTNGADVGYIALSGNAYVRVEEGAHVANVDVSDSATLWISSGAAVSHITVQDNSIAYITGGTLLGGAITYTPETQIHLYATDVTFRAGKISGIWHNGELFSLSLVGVEFNEEYGRPKPLSQQPTTLPPQIVVLTHIVIPTHIEASFDCVKATSPAEKMICGDPALANLDKRLSRLYRQALETSPDSEQIKSSQRHWLRTIRNGCTTVPCMRTAYERRVGVLGKKMSKNSQ
jgi:uncharacterized protein YecT (DUF1311 family)